MYKLVALDVDGTLLNEKHQISKRSKKVIKKLIDSGVKIVLASGRPYLSLIKIAEELKLSTPLISNNGALVKFQNGEIILYKYISAENAKALLAYARKKELYTTFYFPERLCVDKLTKEAKLHLEVEGIKPVEVGDLARVVDQKPIAIHFKEEVEKIEALVKDLKEKFGDCLSVMQSAVSHIDVMHSSVSKGRALEATIKRLNIKAEEVISFGNSFNDLEMLEAAGCGVAVANSPAGVKEKADKITLSNREDGVAVILEDLIKTGQMKGI
ncbi:MAG: Cof-type HAD-IIB family hydrolase [Bacillota bacterium]